MSGMKWYRLKKQGILIVLGMILLQAPFGFSSCSQQKSATQRRVEKEKARKDKEAQKKYEQAIKLHKKNQSAATQSMMKEAKKESPKNTPLKKSSGKKCK
jgi:hypothetical protein